MMKNSPAARSLCAGLLLCFLGTCLLVACSSGKDRNPTEQQSTTDTTPAPTTNTTNTTTPTTPEKPKDYNVTGNWMMPSKPPLMSLKQNGSAVSGTITELQGSGFDPCTAKVVGSIKGDQIEFDEIFICPDNPELEFSVHKSGKMVSENHMRLVAKDGPHPGTQEWYR